MHRHRVGARGNATSFPMPWHTLLARLQKLEDEASSAVGPDHPRTGRDLSHVVEVLLKTGDTGDKDALQDFMGAT